MRTVKMGNAMLRIIYGYVLKCNSALYLLTVNLFGVTQALETSYTNNLIACSLNKSELSAQSVIVRVYGEKTELFINHRKEIRNVAVLHAVGCFKAPLYCKFHNGYVYGYLAGFMLSCHLVFQPHIERLVIDELVRLHSVNIESVSLMLDSNAPVDMTPILFPTLSQMLEHFPDVLADENKHAKFCLLCFTKLQLKAEIEYMRQVLESAESAVVFCHNDLVPKNIIYNESEKTVSFIDFEFSGYNYEAFDIAVHFSEYTGENDVDVSFYLNADRRKSWLRQYVIARNNFVGLQSVPDISVEVERLYDQVAKFDLAVHIFWALWAIIQAQYSSKDYDFVEYAQTRLCAYIARKNSLSNKVASG